MKQLSLLIILFISVTSVNAQEYRDLFEPTNERFTWLGIDYSEVQLVGNFSAFGSIAEEKNADQIRDIYFKAWNRLVLIESDKYDVKGMFKRKQIDYDTHMMMALNARSTPTIHPRVNYQKGDQPFKIPIHDMIDKYDFTGLHGIGVLMIAERLDKNKGWASYKLVAVNLDTKEVILSERICGKPRGFGLKNYWAGSVYQAMKTVKKKKYKQWAKNWKKSKKNMAKTVAKKEERKSIHNYQLARMFREARAGRIAKKYAI